MGLGQTAGPCGPGKKEQGINQVNGGEERWWVGRWEMDREPGNERKSERKSPGYREWKKKMRLSVVALHRSKCTRNKDCMKGEVEKT